MTLRKALLALTIALTAVLWLRTTAQANVNAVASGDPSDLCTLPIAQAEKQMKIPAHLLRAISVVESGRWSKQKKARVAWPWTVMAEGKGRYLPNKQAAIAEVKKLKAKGVRNIDVGCMQVNLHYHPDAFATLDDAFDPVVNVAYAANFLSSLRQDAPSWTSAIGRYHSYNQKYSTPYRRKVLKAWREVRHQANRDLRRAQQERKDRKQHQIAKKQQPKAGAIRQSSPAVKVSAESNRDEATPEKPGAISGKGLFANRSIATRDLLAPFAAKES